MKNIQTLQYLLSAISPIEILNNRGQLIISSIEIDSRHVLPGCLFAAIEGTNTDGHQYIDQAIIKGAVAILCSKKPEKIDPNTVYILVNDSSQALGNVASAFYNYPSQHLKTVGITGTNGKTTTAYLLYQLFTYLGYKCGLISTIEIKIGHSTQKSTHTTPDAIRIQNIMQQMVEEGCEYCFMEVSSHAVDQKRIAGIVFRGAIFTNITHDHLDYHLTFANYLKAKKAFFDQLDKSAIAITNLDDKNGAFMLQNCAAHKTHYALKSMANYRCQILETHSQGMMLKIEGKEVFVKLSGEFNAYNLMAVYAMAIELGETQEVILLNLSKLEPIKGRFETVRSYFKKILAIIDYAHTPDALEKVLEEAKKLKKDHKLICVVGCGGNRDTAKRPKMGQIATELSDRVIFTSDNPRDEAPQDIIREMKEGVRPENLKKVLTIIDRFEAINTACQLAEAEDIIVIAGKGHESYQEIKGIQYDFDDKKTIETLFEQLEL